MKRLALFLALALCSASVPALEADYHHKWCAEHGGVTPSKALEDGSFPDCITDTHAIEFDFGHKWGESVGQALNYAMYTGRIPGIVLIVESGSDSKGVLRVKRVIGHYRNAELLDVLTPAYLGE